MKKLLKILGKFVLVVLVLFVGVSLFFYFQFKPSASVEWGVNFSPPHAEYLGLDYKELYNKILYDLKPKNIRLMAYWEDIEPKQGKFDFSKIDYLLEEAEKTETKVILVLGHKQPRWPECHHPDWYENLSTERQKLALFNMIEEAVKHFKKYEVIKYWQVENEPFFNYGENCPVISEDLLKKEIDIVRKLDSSRQIIVTDSGEKGNWIKASKFADIFGSTMYRKVNNPRWGGYITYPIPAAWYRVQAGAVQTFNSNIKDVFGIELQAEPWFEKDINETPIERQLELESLKDLKDNIEYAKRAGFSQNYFWGVEWWYYMKDKGHGEFWETAKELINKN